MPSKTSVRKVPKCTAKQTRTDPEYWETRLKRMGITMDAGRKIGSESITYGHMVADLDFDGKVTYRPPIGERLDNAEWPISLM